MAPTKVMIIRHAEKPVPEEEAGVEKDGEQDPEALTVRGWQRAGALARFFAPRDDHSQAAGIARPGIIYASGDEAGRKSKRPRQTVEPLAKLLGLEISDELLKGQEDELAAAVLSQEGVVLVSWEHEAIADIARRVGGPAVNPPTWPKDRFDIVLILDRADSGWTMTQVPQMLLAGDREDLLT